MSTGDDATNVPSASPTFFLRIVQKITMTRAGSWIYGRVVPPIDRVLMVKTKGKRSLSPGDTGGTGGLALLTTTGAKSGKPRHTPLGYARDGDSIVIIASNAAHEHNPSWYYNLKANPEVMLTLRGGHHGEYRAEEVTQGEERQRLWEVACEMYPGFADYQTRADRLIPLIHCTPLVK
jgi:deazaflavin-dependent oxidoreductase (nitroreductase family)